MLLRIMRFVGVGTVSIALANLAWAAEVTTDATSAKIGGEFRADWTQSDNGLTKTDGYTPPSTSTLQVHEANITMSGNINANTEFGFEFHLIDTPNNAGGSAFSPLTEGWGKHMFSKMFGFSLGRQKVNQGGWDQAHNDYYRVALGQLIQPTSGLLPFSHYSDMLAFHAMVAGEITLQVLNDVVAPEVGATPDPTNTVQAGVYNENAHPTFVLGWKGDFNGIRPLVNIGSFDNNKSNYFDVGIATEMAGLTASLDFHQQTDTWQYADGAEMKDTANVLTSFSLWAGYAIKGTATPWLYYSSFDVKQSTDGGAEDAKANTAGMWNDNGSTLGIGANLHMMGDNFEPYLAIVQHAGKWYDAAGEEESKSEMMIKLGASGSI